MAKAKKCVVAVEGGLGKNVMFTAVLKELSKKYEKIYVLSPYFDVFKACPYVTDAFPMGQVSTLYQQLCLSEDCDVLWKEPYTNQKFIKKQVHLFDAWADELGITLTEKAMNMIPVINKYDEVPAVIEQTNKLQELIKGQPFILVQFCGGQSPLAPQKDAQGNAVPYNDHNEGLKRNYHRAQELIDLLHKEYPNDRILHFALPNEPNYNGAEKVTAPYLVFHEICKYAHKVVCTDSSLQHLATGMCKDVTVIWGETRPEHFGYSCNKNVCAQNVMNSQPYFKPIGASPAIVDFPTPEEVMKVVKQGDPVEHKKED